jgi:hypothetical protein
MTPLFSLAMPSLRVLLLLLTALLAAPSPVAQPRILFDTDFGGDADDLGALVMLLHLANAGECALIGVASWSTEAYAVPAIEAVLRTYGRPQTPIGARQDSLWHERWQYSKPIVDRVGSRMTHREAEPAPALYRRLLAAQPDSSVTIVTVGPLANLLHLVETLPDSVSALSGPELMRQKVREVVVMGGAFPEGRGEWNFYGNMPGVTRAVLAGLDVPVVFSGYEVGEPIRTGRALNRHDPASPLAVGYRHFSEHAPWMKDRFRGEILDNASYDQTAVLYAVRGGLGIWWDLVRGGRVEVAENGDNVWVPGPPTNQAYLRLRAAPSILAEQIDALMLNNF